MNKDLFGRRITNEPEGDLLTPRQAARLLGITTHTCCRWLRERRLPGVRIGRLWRIPRTELLEWIRTEAAAHVVDPEEGAWCCVGGGK